MATLSVKKATGNKHTHMACSLNQGRPPVMSRGWVLPVWAEGGGRWDLGRDKVGRLTAVERGELLFSPTIDSSVRDRIACMDEPPGKS